MIFNVVMAKAARADLADRHAYVRHEADEIVADRYVERIHKRLQILDRFPERGSLRPEFGFDIRALSFERRLPIIYRIDGEVVRILRILDAFRDLRGLTL